MAGPNEGGTLILHANPSLVFTSTIQDYCGMSALDSCSAAVTSVAWDPGKKIVFHAIAAFPPGSSPRLKALSFGIDFDSTKFVLAARGTCADFEIPGVGWPGSGTGTSQSWTTGAQTGPLTEVYWFVGYANSEQVLDSTSVSLIPHPLQHGVFVDDAFPSEVDTVAAYGRLGFGTLGILHCMGGNQLGGDTPEGGIDGGIGDESQSSHFAYRSGSLAVSPKTIALRWPCWTFLSAGSTESRLEGLILMIGGRPYAPTRVLRTTTTSRLWTFDHPAADTTDQAVLTLQFTGGGTTNVELVTTPDAPPPPELYDPEQLNLVTVRGGMGYDSTRIECNVETLHDPDPNLANMLRVLGITRVIKVARGRGEGLLPGPTPASPRRRASFERIGRSYHVRVPSGVCGRSFIEIMRQITSIERSTISIRGQSFSNGPYDTWFRDPFYSEQWNLRLKYQTGWYGIGANHAWWASIGSGGQIAIVDEYFPSHPDIAANVGYGDYLCDPDDGCNLHGLWCASTAAAAANDSGMVGVAPQAKIVPVLMPADWDEPDLIYALWLAHVYLHNDSEAVASVLSMSVGLTAPTTWDFSDLLDAVETLVLEDGFAIFAAAALPTSIPMGRETYPSAWDQNNTNPQRRLVLSVSGSKKDGSFALHPEVSEADIHAPEEDIYVATYVGTDPTYDVKNSNTGSLAVPQVAAAGLLYSLGEHGCGPSSIYQELLDTARMSPDGIRIVDAAAATYTTGIDGIVHVEARMARQYERSLRPPERVSSAPPRSRFSIDSAGLLATPKRCR